MGSTDNKAEIEYMGIDMVVVYDFEPAEAETRYEPGCAAEANITAILVGDVDIADIVGDDHICRIAGRIAEAHEESFTDNADLHADYLVSQYKERAHV